MPEVKEKIKKLVLSYNDIKYNRYKKNNVAMVHIGRSGSTVVGDMLDKHKLIKWDSEIYSTYVSKFENNKPFKKTKQEALKYLQYRMRGTPKTIYGFEFKFFHLQLFNVDFEEYLMELRKIGCQKIIVLKRLNLLRKIVSSLISYKTNNWHKTTKDRPVINTIHVDVENIFIDGQSRTLIEYLNLYSSHYDILKKIGNKFKTLNLTYEEDIQGSPLVAYTKICDFLDVDQQPVDIRFKKTNPYKLHQIIENFDQINGYLKNSPYKWMLND